MNDTLFLEKLKSHSLLPGDLNEEVQAKDTTAKKTACFLDNVIDRSLSIDNFELLHKLLIVMSDEEDINNDLLKQLSSQMQEELAKETALITKKGKGYTECSCLFIYRSLYKTRVVSHKQVCMWIAEIALIHNKVDMHLFLHLCVCMWVCVHLCGH